jgi:hypothetical protein
MRVSNWTITIQKDSQKNQYDRNREDRENFEVWQKKPGGMSLLCETGEMSIALTTCYLASFETFGPDNVSAPTRILCPGWNNWEMFLGREMIRGKVDTYGIGTKGIELLEEDMKRVKYYISRAK